MCVPGVATPERSPLTRTWLAPPHVRVACLVRRASCSQELHEAMHGSFGCVHDTMNEFAAAAKSVFGSGYAWLAVDREGTLLVETTANQVRTDTCCTPPRLYPPSLSAEWRAACDVLHVALRCRTHCTAERTGQCRCWCWTCGSTRTT